MANKKNFKKAGLITGVLLAGSVAGFAGTSTSNATADLLTYNALGSGSEIRVEIADRNSNSPISTLELKCGEKKTGESKCGEGKCGESKKGEKEKVKSNKKTKASKADVRKAKKAKKSEGKTKESKCGEGKCGN